MTRDRAFIAFYLAVWIVTFAICECRRQIRSLSAKVARSFLEDAE